VRALIDLLDLKLFRELPPDDDSSLTVFAERPVMSSSSSVVSAFSDGDSIDKSGWTLLLLGRLSERTLRFERLFS